MSSLFEPNAQAERQGQPQGAANRVERAVDEAIAARNAGRPEEAIERMEAALSWLDAGQVRRELRVAVPRELGLARLLMGQSAKAREALLLALEQAAADPVLCDPVRAALATLELMAGTPERAKQMIEGRGRNRRATLSAVARIHLYEGNMPAAEAALQEADQAPGGTTASSILHPPATVLRCFASLWGKRPDQARMLYDGVATRDNPLWRLVRVTMLRAMWVQSGDGRWLQVALSESEQLREDESANLPGLLAAAHAQHAVCLALIGELAMAVEAADQAMAALASNALTLPEWPKPAVLADCALVYRDANDRERWSRTMSQWDALAWAEWNERMQLVSGTRAQYATTSDEPKVVQGDGAGSLESLALRLLEDPRNPRLAALRAVGAAASALGVEWTNAEGATLGRIGARAQDPAAVETVRLGDASTLSFYKPQRDAVRALSRDALDALSRVITLREDETKKLTSLHDLMATAEGARRVAEERLEQVRRPGTDKGHGGRFPTVVGRSDKLRLVLDRLATLAPLTLPVLLDGAPGSGRRHLAQALFLCGSDDATGSTRAPIVDASLVPEGEQQAALVRATEKRGDTVIVANAEHLDASATAWLVEQLATPGHTRWLATMDQRATGATAEALRLAFTSGHVRVPGLDERLEDLPLLIDQFLREAGRRADDLSTASRAVLARRPFAGHVLELRTIIRNAVVRAAGAAIQPEHVERVQADKSGGLTEDPLVLGWQEAMRAFQKDMLVRALEATAGSKSRAADLLGVSREKLTKLAKEHDLDSNDE